MSPPARVRRTLDYRERPDALGAGPADERATRELGDGGASRVGPCATPLSTHAWVEATYETPLIEVQDVPLPTDLDDRLVILREPSSDRARGYRLLRHLLFGQGDPRTIAVTSAVPGEGKTTCALNLALAMAEDALTSVLLLEANLRRPALARALRFAPSRSLLEEATRFTDVGPPYPVVSVSRSRLHVAALPTAPLDGKRLDRTLFSVALSDLRGAYDYIIIDAASVLESGDADVVGECSSGVIITARAGYSRKDATGRAIAQLKPAPVTGSVLIDA